MQAKRNHIEPLRAKRFFDPSSVISGEKRSLRHVLFQADLAGFCRNPVLKAIAKRMKERGKPHKLVIVTIANAVLKTGLPWRVTSAA